MFKLIAQFFSGLFSGKANGPLSGIKIKPFVRDDAEPYKTFSQAITAQLLKRGVEFAASAERTCELDWEILGGSQLRVKASVSIGPFAIRTDVREGYPLREIVDFDIDKLDMMDPNEKVILFFKKAAEKIAERLEDRYQRDLGRMQNSP